MQVTLKNKYIPDIVIDIIDIFVLFLIDQPIDQVAGLDPIVGCVHARIQGEDDLLVIVRNLPQRRELTFPGFGGVHGFRDLDVLFLVGLGGDEIHFLIYQGHLLTIVLPASDLPHIHFESAGT